MQTIGSLSDVTGTGGTVELGGATLTVGNGGASGTFTGDINGGGATGTVVKTGAGVQNLDGTQNYDTLTASGGTLNVNGDVGTAPGTASVSVTGAGTKLRFGTVSQTLSSLTIGAGSTVVFTSGVASGAFSGGGGKTASLDASAAVPEPGTLGLLLVGALGMLNRRRRAA